MKNTHIDVEGIKAYIRENGVKQDWLASQCGMTRNALSLSLNNKRGLQASEYLSICSALGVPLERFASVADDGGAA